MHRASEHRCDRPTHKRIVALRRFKHHQHKGQAAEPKHYQAQAQGQHIALGCEDITQMVCAYADEHCDKQQTCDRVGHRFLHPRDLRVKVHRVLSKLQTDGGV